MDDLRPIIRREALLTFERMAINNLPLTKLARKRLIEVLKTH
jgi:hypothetical protein